MEKMPTAKQGRTRKKIIKIIQVYGQEVESA